MVDCDLTDGYLDLITPRLNQLELIDISFNHFAPDSLLNFILAINRMKGSELTLRTLNLAGNDLNTSSERKLATAITELLLVKRSLVHLDLSLTNL